MITTVLMMVACGLAAHLFGDTSGFLRRGGQFDEAREAELLCLSQLRSEAQEAVQWLVPDRASVSFPQAVPSTELVFRRPDPQQTRPPADLVEAWDPVDPAGLVTIRYYLADGKLMRQVAGGQPATLAENVSGFSVRLESARLLVVRLQVTQGPRQRALSARIYLARGSDG